jgi:hypothetical protein
VTHGLMSDRWPGVFDYERCRMLGIDMHSTTRERVLGVRGV